jgi:hypothetical protein
MEGLMTQLNRRSILTGAAAVPAATAVTAFPAIGLCKGVSSELIGLIEEHRAANAAFLVEVTRDDRQPGCGTLADAKVKAEISAHQLDRQRHVG